MMAEADALKELWSVVLDRRSNPVEGSYTCKLLADKELIYEKLLEEVQELVEAAREGNLRGGDSVTWESADILYHLLVLIASCDIDLSEVLAELEKRRK